MTALSRLRLRRNGGFMHCCLKARIYHRDEMTEERQNQLKSDPRQVDILVFGAHPDDVEWGAGGTLLTLKPAGTSFGIVDLTRGEMGSRGTSEERDKEAQEAAFSMGARFRENLGMPDGGVIDSVENRKRIGGVIGRH